MGRESGGGWGYRGPRRGKGGVRVWRMRKKAVSHLRLFFKTNISEKPEQVYNTLTNLDFSVSEKKGNFWSQLHYI